MTAALEAVRRPLVAGAVAVVASLGTALDEPGEHR